MEDMPEVKRFVWEKEKFEYMPKPNLRTVQTNDKLFVVDMDKLEESVMKSLKYIPLFEQPKPNRTGLSPFITYGAVINPNKLTALYTFGMMGAGMKKKPEHNQKHKSKTKRQINRIITDPAEELFLILNGSKLVSTLTRIKLLAKRKSYKYCITYNSKIKGFEKQPLWIQHKDIFKFIEAAGHRLIPINKLKHKISHTRG